MQTSKSYFDFLPPHNKSHKSENWFFHRSYLTSLRFNRTKEHDSNCSTPANIYARYLKSSLNRIICQTEITHQNILEILNASMSCWGYWSFNVLLGLLESYNLPACLHLCFPSFFLFLFFIFHSLPLFLFLHVFPLTCGFLKSHLVQSMIIYQAWCPGFCKLLQSKLVIFYAERVVQMDLLNCNRENSDVK